MPKPRLYDIWVCKNGAVELFLNQYDQDSVRYAARHFKAHGWLNPVDYDENGDYLGIDQSWGLDYFVRNIAHALGQAETIEPMAVTQETVIPECTCPTLMNGHHNGCAYLAHRLSLR